MDNLLTLAYNIIIKLENRDRIEIGYSKMNQQLYEEIPIFVRLLKQYANNPENFLKLLTDIYKHWGQFLSKEINKDIQNYNTLFNSIKIMELDKQRSLIEFAMQHPANIKAREDEINSLTSNLENMFSAPSELANIFSKTSISKNPVIKGISKRKYPRRNK